MAKIDTLDDIFSDDESFEQNEEEKKVKKSKSKKVKVAEEDFFDQSEKEEENSFNDEEKETIQMEEQKDMDLNDSDDIMALDMKRANALKLPYEKYKIIKNIIIEGFENNLSHNDIKIQMVKEDIAFNDIIKIFNYITAKEELIIPTFVVKNNVEKFFKERQLASKLKKIKGDLMFSSFEKSIEECISQVKGANENIVINILKRICKENNKTFPAKPRSLKPRPVKVYEHIVCYFVENKEDTVNETSFESFLLGYVAPRTAKRYVKMFSLFKRLADLKKE